MQTNFYFRVETSLNASRRSGSCCVQDDRKFGRPLDLSIPCTYCSAPCRHTSRRRQTVSRLLKCCKFSCVLWSTPEHNAPPRHRTCNTHTLPQPITVSCLQGEHTTTESVFLSVSSFELFTTSIDTHSRKRCRKRQTH